MSRRKVIIDTDIGCDDATTLLLALTDPEVEVVAITTVFGNTPVCVATSSAKKILQILRATHIPVYQGCGTSLIERENQDGWPGHGTDGLGDANFSEELKEAPEYAPTHQAGLTEKSHAAGAIIALTSLHKFDISLLGTDKK